MTAAPDLSYIAEPLRPFAIPVDSLTSLVGNPRRGDVDALVEILRKFGQRQILTARRHDDGTLELTVGNHRWLAAKHLGWSHVAVIVCDDDDQEARAWSLAENHSHDMGDYDAAELAEFISTVEDLDLLAITGYSPLDVDSILGAKPESPSVKVVESAGSGAGYVWASVGRLQVRVKAPAYKARVAAILAEHNGDETAASLAVAKILGFGPEDLVLD